MERGGVFGWETGRQAGVRAPLRASQRAAAISFSVFSHSARARAASVASGVGAHVRRPHTPGTSAATWQSAR